jgi:sterol 14-demethylase
MASCRELASDVSTLTTFQQHYGILQKKPSPIMLLFPWFPGPAKRVKEALSKALFTTLWDYIEGKKEGASADSGCD